MNRAYKHHTAKSERNFRPQSNEIFELDLLYGIFGQTEFVERGFY